MAGQREEMRDARPFPLDAPGGHVAPDEQRQRNDRNDDENSDEHAILLMRSLNRPHTRIPSLLTGSHEALAARRPAAKNVCESGLAAGRMSMRCGHPNGSECLASPRGREPLRDASSVLLDVRSPRLEGRAIGDTSSGATRYEPLGARPVEPDRVSPRRRRSKRRKTRAAEESSHRVGQIRRATHARAPIAPFLIRQAEDLVVGTAGGSVGAVVE